MKEHFNFSATKITRSVIQDLHVQAKEFFEDIQPSLSPEEYGFIAKSLQSWAILTLKLLIKNHKKPDVEGHFPMCLVIPATSFIATFSSDFRLELGQLFLVYDNTDSTSKKLT